MAHGQRLVRRAPTLYHSSTSTRRRRRGRETKNAMNASPSARRMRFTQRGVPAGRKRMGACPGDEDPASHEYVGDCHAWLVQEKLLD